MAEAQLRVKQVRSAIGSKPKHRGTLRALGLGRIGRVSVLPDRPEIRGMVGAVKHLVEVSRDEAAAAPVPAARAKAATRSSSVPRKATK